MNKKRWLHLTMALVFSLSLLIGCAKAEEEEELEPIRIGGLFDVTGGLAIVGYPDFVTAEAVIAKINAEGGIDGRQVEYYFEDSASNVETAISKYRKLVLGKEVDFMLVGCNSAVNVAIAPVAKELNTITFVSGTAREITGTKGNRYIFRILGNEDMKMAAFVNFAVEEIGKRAYLIAADYEWGHSILDAAERYLGLAGGEVVAKEFAPTGTVDYVPYLAKLDPGEVDILMSGFFAGDLIKLMTQATELGFELPYYMGGLVGTTPASFGESVSYATAAVTGARPTAGYPTNVQPFHKAFRDAVGIDEHGFFKDTGDLASVCTQWAVWEGFYFIKKGIEESGWKSRVDNLKFVEVLEGMEVKASDEFPTGDKFIRAEDHQAMSPIFLHNAVGEYWAVFDIMWPEDYLPLYPANVDYTKEAMP